jgi:quercetin dioxygenase-like cupin family protein
MLAVEIAPGATTGRHFHEGDEFATVIEGEVQINVQGQEPRIVKAGEAYHNHARVPHETKNLSSAPAKIVATFVVEKGKPLTTPAPVSQ